MEKSNVVDYVNNYILPPNRAKLAVYCSPMSDSEMTSSPPSGPSDAQFIWDARQWRTEREREAPSEPFQLLLPFVTPSEASSVASSKG